MDSQTETNQVTDAVTSAKERSTVEFPYTDLESAVEVVKGVHNAGGNACESDQLAAQLALEAKGGGFRLRINGAKTFGLISYERGGRISLTELGQQITDPLHERQARMAAFLAVELYSKVFENFKGGPLPPQAALDRSLVSMGVGAGVKEKARQVLMRSAKQAGFFEHASDRLIKPSIKPEGGHHGAPPSGGNEQRNRKGGGDGGDGTDDKLHPLIRGLLITLPNPGDPWEATARVNWLTMANSIFNAIYQPTTDGIEIGIKQKQ